MAGFICDNCGTAFDRPLHTRDDQDLCPICGYPYYSPAVSCTCGNPMKKGEALCQKCRSELLQKIVVFADYLTAEEEEQIDRWMEATGSITERSSWS